MSQIQFKVTGGKYTQSSKIFEARKIQIDACKHSNAQTFTKVGETKELPQREGLISESVQITENSAINLIKFIILEGWEDFSSVHSIEI